MKITAKKWYEELSYSADKKTAVQEGSGFDHAGNVSAPLPMFEAHLTARSIVPIVSDGDQAKVIGYSWRYEFASNTPLFD